MATLNLTEGKAQLLKGDVKMVQNDLMVVTRPTKADKNKEYTALIVRLSYRDIILTCDKALISEILGVSVVSLVELCSKNKAFIVGDISLPAIKS